jgi:membrane-associated phospholipid phosphatase
MSDATVSPPPAVRRTKRQRRPTGTPPPLPHRIGPSTAAWVVLATVIVTGAFLISEHTPWRRLGDRANTWLLQQLAAVRTPWLTDLANWINATAQAWYPWIGVAVVLLVAVFRRWRHLLVLTLCLFFLEIIGRLIYDGLSRPRPYGVPIIGSWNGYSAPSPVLAALTFFLVSALYCLAVPGRPRTAAAAGVAAVVALVGLSRLYLAVDHPDDVLFGVTLGVAIPVAAFRFFTPDEIFGVAYRRGRTAHVQVTGRRGEGIRQAVHHHLGLIVLEIRPVGLASSAGSMPVRLTVAGDPDQYLFGKLYTRGHVRSDRWYKLWRTIRYGSLEDEHPFSSVLQLTQYEDYALRLVREAGVRTAAPYGIVEITPEREYLLVTEFFTGAAEIGAADIDDAIIDQGLELIRKRWDAGLAHRDIKPGNLMVRDGQLLLIDVAFVQLRPSPWRQAVDLGNMMLVLAVRTDPQRVYHRALAYFTPDELAEAFAATRGVASPTQLRAFLKRDPRDLLDQFRALAPPRQPVAWSATWSGPKTWRCADGGRRAPSRKSVPSPGILRMPSGPPAGIVGCRPAPGVPCCL